MPSLSSYLSEPSLVIGFKALHRDLGTGTVVDIVRENSDSDYVHVQFARDGSTIAFGADVFFNRWEGGLFFSHDTGELVNLDRKLKGLLAHLRQNHISPHRSPLPVLQVQDYRLCLAWAGRKNTSDPCSASLVAAIGSSEAARLMSARVAELAAARYFTDLGDVVVDLSIRQLYSASDSAQWKDADLLISGHPVDVKNARRSFSSPTGYVEHCVPLFKRDRTSKTEVSIVGVLSEYRSVDEIEAGDGECTILGEVTVAKIRRLYTWMHKRFGNLIDFAGLWRPDYQPGWAFEYSGEFYRDRKAALVAIDDVAAEMRRTHAGLDGLPLWLLALSPNMELAGRESMLPIGREVLADLASLRGTLGHSRPVLFIYLMAYMVEAISRGESETDVVPVLRHATLPIDVKHDMASRPLGLYDPLRYIASLLNVFSAIFAAIREHGITFRAFKLQSPSILKGRTDSGTWIVLLAYCGGWRKQPGFTVKCGNTPLHLGRHLTCAGCGHLVCDKCGFCALDCKLVNERRADMGQPAATATTNVRPS